MGLGIFGWQLLILITIVVAGRSRGIAVNFWVIWTLVQVAGFPLSILQFGTIWLGYTIAAALFPERPSDSVNASPPTSTISVPSGEKLQRANDLGPKKPSTLKAAHHPPSKSISEILGSATAGFSFSPMPSDSTPAKVDGLARIQEGVEIEEVRRQIRDLYRTPNVGVSVSKGAAPLAPTSMPSSVRASASEMTAKRTSTPPVDPEISDSLLEHLEMHSRSSVDRSLADSRSSDKILSGAQGAMCLKCDPKKSETVSGMRYCSNCGAFAGMTH